MLFAFFETGVASYLMLCVNITLAVKCISFSFDWSLMLLQNIFSRDEIMYQMFTASDSESRLF